MLLTALAMCAALAANTSSATPIYDNLFVFGDSNSDTGRRLALEGLPASPPYYAGRHSNGPVAVEYLASALGVSLVAGSTAGSNNFAVGGALTGAGNLDTSPTLAGTGMLGQFSTYSGIAGGVADPHALYFIWGGGNDITQCGGAACTGAQLGASVSNLTTLVSDLYGIGARHFMVVGQYGGNAAATTLNSLLQSAVQTLDTSGEDVLFFNARSVVASMLGATNPYGFTNTSSTTPCYTGALNGTGGTVCSNPDQYVFWDSEGHLTARANLILGDAFAAAVVPEPGSFALTGAGLGALLLLRWLFRRRSGFGRLYGRRAGIAA